LPESLPDLGSIKNDQLPDPNCARDIVPLAASCRGPPFLVGPKGVGLEASLNHKNQKGGKGMRSCVKLGVIGLAMAVAIGPAAAEKKYGPGVTDTEITIGQTIPFSGPASTFGAIGRTMAAYVKMINSKGGVNGRKINLIAYDDAFSPPKAIEQTRKLVENDNVLAIWGTIGTATNMAIAKYLNTAKVPQILVSTASPKMNDPETYPYTTAFYMPSDSEASVYAKWLLKNVPDAKIGILYQNDDFGKGYVDGLKRGLGDKAATMIVKEVPYDLSSPTLDSQVLQLQASGANVLFSASFPKFAAQAFTKANDLGWKPLHLIVGAAAPTLVRMDGIGKENAAGIVSGLFLKDIGEPTWDNEKPVQDFRAFAKEYMPDSSPSDPNLAMGYSEGETLVRILQQCGDDLSRENLIKQATNVRGLQLSMFLSGITIDISPEDRSAWKNLQIVKFDGKRWQPLGAVMSKN